jgi:hypothetical protein
LSGIVWAVYRVVLWVQHIRFAFRAYGLLLNEIHREIRVVKKNTDRLEFQLNRDDSKPRLTIPPPLEMNPTVDATDWLEDDKKTSVLPDPCFPVGDR